MSTLQSALQSTQPSLSSLHSPAVAPLSRLSEPPLPPAPPPLSDSASAALLTARGWLHRELLSGFLAPDWDEVRYLSSALQLTTSSALLADLASLLTEIDCEISSAVLSRHSSLLSQATNIGQLQQKLTAAHSRLRSLYQSVQRIQSSLSTPYARLSSDSLQLSHLQSTCELLRQCQRVLGLVERLRAVEAVDAKDLVKVAGALSELRQVLQETDLSGIELVDAERPFIDEVEERVRGEGRRWLQLSLEGHNQADVGYALQVFYSLRSSDLVAIVDLTLSRALDTLSTHVRRMTDVTALTSTAAASKAPVKGAAPPTTSMSTFRSTLWDRVDSLLSSLLSLHTQMCTLEAVLQKKRDPSTHVLYLDVVSEQRWPKGVLHAWWQSTCELLEREMEATSRGSSFVRSVLVNEYPRLHAAFSALLGRLRGEGRELLRCLQVFEQAYLAKTLAKLNEPLQLMTTPTSTSASPTPLPSRSDVSAFIHCIDDALSSITDNDVELQVAVAGNVNRALATFAALCESRLNINDDRDVLGSSGTGHSSVALSAVQRINSELFLLLSAVKQQLSAAEVRRRYPSIGAAAVAKVERGWQSLHELSDAILTHLIRNVIAQLEAAVFTMQDDDFAASRAIPTEGSNAIVTLRKRLSFLTKQLLPSYTSSLHDTSKLSVTATIVQQGQTRHLAPRTLPAKSHALTSPPIVCACSEWPAVCGVSAQPVAGAGHR